MQLSRHLQLVAVAAPEGESSPALPLPLSRAADRLEPWPHGDDAVFRIFERSARQTGLPVQLAARLVVERELILEELPRPDLIAQLDDRAAAASVDRALDAGTAAYLRGLSARCARPQPSPGRLALPARLRTRIGERRVAVLLNHHSISLACSWEQAAVITGYTMTEWAGFTALELARD